MTKTLIVEDIKEDDKQEVRQLLVESYLQYEYDHKDHTLWDAYLKNITLSLDNPNVDRILVAKNESKILGTLQLFESSLKAYNKPELEIYSPIIRLLAVRPSARGLGVAQELLKSAIAYSKSIQATSIYLHTSDSMQKATKLYEWFGFERDTTKDFDKGELVIKSYRLDL